MKRVFVALAVLMAFPFITGFWWYCPPPELLGPEMYLLNDAASTKYETNIVGGWDDPSFAMISVPYPDPYSGTYSLFVAGGGQDVVKKVRLAAPDAAHVFQVSLLSFGSDERHGEVLRVECGDADAISFDARKVTDTWVRHIGMLKCKGSEMTITVKGGVGEVWLFMDNISIRQFLLPIPPSAYAPRPRF